MKIAKAKLVIGLALLGAACGWMVGRAGAAAPASIGGRAKGFTFPHTDESGHLMRIRGDARTLKNGQIEFTPGIIETYRGTNIDMIVEAPHCTMDRKREIAFSPGELSVRTTDERFSIRGNGFVWQMSNSHLIISNQVQTVITRRLAGPKAPTLATSPNVATPSTGTSTTQASSTNVPPAKAELIDIHSDRFEYSSTVAVFRGGVMAKQEEGTLTCGVLTVTFDQAGSSPEKIEADQNVTFQQKEARMTGQKALFLLKDDLITFTGHPTWSVSGKEGAGEIVRINSRTRDFRVEGNVLVSFVPDQMLPLDWLARSSPTNSPSTNRPPIKIRAAELDYRSNLAVFRGDVRADDSQGGELACGILTNVFTGADGKLAELIAQDRVEFSQGQTGVKADRAVYQATNDLVVVTGNPVWKIAEGEGRSEVLTINPKTRQLLAERNVSLKLINALSNALELPLPASGSETNSLARPSQDIEIMADRMRYKPGSVIFLGHVRVTSPQRLDDEIDCQMLAAFFSGENNKLEQLVAEDGVRIRQGNIRGVGHKAIYTVAKGLIELSGHARTGRPQIMLEGQTYTADQLILDRIHGTYRLKGHPRVEVERSAARKTLPTSAKP